MSQNQNTAGRRFNLSRYIPYPAPTAAGQTGRRMAQKFFFPIPQRDHAPWKTKRQVIVSFCIFFCTMGLGNSWGVYQSYYESNLLDSYSSSTISWIGTMQGFLLSLVGFFSGPLYDKGYVRSLFYIGSVLNVVGLLGTSFATQYATIFLAFGVALGLGCGILYVPAIALISSHFEGQQAALPTAIAMSGSSMGGIVYPILFRRLIEEIGFSSAGQVLTAINGGLLLISCLLVLPKKEGETIAGGTTGESPTTLQGLLHSFKALLEWKLVLFGGCAMLMNFGIDVPFYYIPTFVSEQLKQPPEVGASLLTGLNASSLFGRLALNWLSEHTKPLLIWQFTILITGLLLFLWFTIKNFAEIIIFVICYGFVDGGLISLIAPSLKELYPDDDSSFGAQLGIVEGLQGVGFLVGPPIAGAILASPAGYFGVSLFNGTLFMVIFLLVGIFFTRKHFARPKKKEPGEEILLEPQTQGSTEAVMRRRSV
ncbi:MFS general substrate transporter [Hypoxylon sp. FL1150]|nr:MFS general substrate transporter [Hypoxylon sp. FL1150]